MCILRQAFEVPCVVCQELLICCDKGSIAAPNKKCHQWDVRQVLPIGGIFAECSTRHPSDNKFISLIEVKFIGKIGKIGKIGIIGRIGRIGEIGE